MRLYLKLLREAICWNQGELIQYSYLTSIFHRYLKEVVNTTPDNHNDIINALNGLINFSNRNFQRISTKNFDFLHRYFMNRAKYNPRICIKATFHDEIVELFRDQPVNYIARYSIDSNTGFYHVYQTGTYFLCNDIPSAAKEGKYINPRLDNQKVKKYKLSFTRYLSRNEFDDDWISCWKRSNEKELSPFSCYKSTLIIPMTLWNNSLSPIFKQLTKIENIERTIFGFLCFDHIDTNFFNSNEDVDIGYIFADLLSIYLFHRLNYTVLSDTFKRAVKIVGLDHKLTLRRPPVVKQQK